MAGLKIKTVKINGEDRISPECMRLLTAFADHRDKCPRCYAAFHRANGDYCPVGADILRELSARPEVEPYTKPTDGTDDKCKSPE